MTTQKLPGSADPLKHVVPWGRTLDEYRRMFSLTDGDLNRRIIGVGDGPASFNAEMHALGRRVVSIDPIYVFKPGDILARVHEVREELVTFARDNPHKYVWNDIKSPEDMGERRLRAAETFARDFPAGRTEGRYLAEALPDLPFEDRSFDLALCSHFLFTYGHLLDMAFHLAGIRELLRVADEARIYPLLMIGGARCPFVDDVVEALNTEGYSARIESVAHEFQLGANQMLRVSRS